VIFVAHLSPVSRQYFDLVCWFDDTKDIPCVKTLPQQLPKVSFVDQPCDLTWSCNSWKMGRLNKKSMHIVWFVA